MRWLRSTLEGAGLHRVGVSGFLSGLILLSGFVGYALFLASKVAALAVFATLGLVGLGFEALALIAKNRRSELIKAWPEVVDSMSSAVSAGISIPEAFDALAQRGPMRFRQAFAGFNRRLDSGWSNLDSLDWLKSQFGEAHSDRLIELLRLSSLNGGEGLAPALKAQSKQLREDLLLIGQLESKQSWVAGTAKLAVAAPWIIVALLSSRPENAAIYNTANGSAVLLVGFMVSLGAYRLIHVMAVLPQQPRVFG